MLSQENEKYRPYLTHSYTGTKNVRVLMQQAGIDERDITIYYVSRTYLTRHGAGPLPEEDASMRYYDDTNTPHPFQGKLRFAPLDPDLRVRCAFDAKGPYKLVLTHCDQVAPTMDADLYAYGPTRQRLTTDRETALSRH